MPKVRAYAAEYKRRIELGLSRGLSRAEARGHKTLGPNAKPPVQDAKLEAALRQLRKHPRSLTKVASEASVSRERLSKYIKVVAGAHRKGGGWQFNDTRRRRLKIIEAGVDQPPLIRVAGYDPVYLAGLHAFEAGEMIADPDTLLADFQKRWAAQGVTDVQGHWHPFSTDPNQIARAFINQDYDFEKYYFIEHQEG